MSLAGAVAAGYTVVTDTNEFYSLDTENEKFVSAQFGSTHFPYELDGIGDRPHLHEMAQTALDILDNDANGFFLMIEGSRIDHAGHANDIERMIHETIEFDRSVETVYDWMGGREDTLLMVTADHETGGLAVTNNNGVGNYPSVSWSTSWHTATPVPVYGFGCNAYLVTNVFDNTEIYSVATSAVTGPEVCIATHSDTNGFHMTWTSLSNQVYQLEYSSSISVTNWVPLGSITAAASLVSIVDTNMFSSSRFYRLMQE